MSVHFCWSSESSIIISDVDVELTAIVVVVGAWLVSSCRGLNWSLKGGSLGIPSVEKSEWRRSIWVGSDKIKDSLEEGDPLKTGRGDGTWSRKKSLDTPSLFQLV